MPETTTPTQESGPAAEGRPGPDDDKATADTAAPEAAADDAAAPEATPDTAAPEAAADDAAAPEATADTAARGRNVDGGEDFMRDLVAAMRKVADETRTTGVTDLRSRADERMRQLEADAERRREELRSRAEADISGVGDWAKAEAERIKNEAEQRVVARRSQLEQQLAAETTRAEAETSALRDRVAEYERELDAYYAQLSEINDPAAFAAAAKRMPMPPQLKGTAAPRAVAAPRTVAAPRAVAAPAASTADTAAMTKQEAAPANPEGSPVDPSTAASNGVPGDAAQVHPAEEEVLAARLAQLDATLDEAEATAPVTPSADPVTTEVVVKGLGSFGAITGFRQSLSGVDGIDGVALSLGQTGEFVFRATHAQGFDVRSAITGLEGDGAKVEDRAEGGLRVTLDRAR